MRTFIFNPNLTEIERRKDIIPFGRAAKYEVQESKAVPFILYTTEQEFKTVNSKQEIYNASSICKANLLNYKIQGEISIRITNIPLKTTQNELFEILLKHCNDSGIEILKLRPFSRISLIFDKETQESRGLAYVNCLDLEKARELAKIVRGIMIEEYVLCAELLNN